MATVEQLAELLRTYVGSLAKARHTTAETVFSAAGRPLCIWLDDLAPKLQPVSHEHPDALFVVRHPGEEPQAPPLPSELSSLPAATRQALQDLGALSSEELLDELLAIKAALETDDALPDELIEETVRLWPAHSKTLLAHAQELQMWAATKELYELSHIIYTESKLRSDEAALVYQELLFQYRTDRATHSRHILEVAIECEISPETRSRPTEIVFRIADTENAVRVDAAHLPDHFQTEFAGDGGAAITLEQLRRLLADGAAADEEFNGLALRLAQELSPDGAMADTRLKLPEIKTDVTLSRSPAVMLKLRGKDALVRAQREVLARAQSGADLGAFNALITNGYPAPSGDKIVLPMPANTEQKSVAEKLPGSTLTVIQGPPGTGKTHTIANILAGLLAQGKRVLVTARTDRAIEEVRERLPDGVRDLAVSFFTDSAKNEQLREYAQKLDRTVAHGRTLDEMADDIELNRRDLLETERRLAGVRERLRELLSVKENREHTIAGLALPISGHIEILDAAPPGCAKIASELLCRNIPALWPHPLSDTDWLEVEASVAQLLELLGDDIAAFEEELARLAELPDLDALPHPDTFDAWCSEIGERGPRTATEAPSWCASAEFGELADLRVTVESLLSLEGAGPDELSGTLQRILSVGLSPADLELAAGIAESTPSALLERPPLTHLAPPAKDLAKEALRSVAETDESLLGQLREYLQRKAVLERILAEGGAGWADAAAEELGAAVEPLLRSIEASLLAVEGILKPVSTRPLLVRIVDDILSNGDKRFELWDRRVTGLEELLSSEEYRLVEVSATSPIPADQISELRRQTLAAMEAMPPASGKALSPRKLAKAQKRAPAVVSKINVNGSAPASREDFAKVAMFLGELGSVAAVRNNINSSWEVPGGFPYPEGSVRATEALEFLGQARQAATAARGLLAAWQDLSAQLSRTWRSTYGHSVPDRAELDYAARYLEISRLRVRKKELSVPESLIEAYRTLQGSFAEGAEIPLAPELLKKLHGIQVLHDVITRAGEAGVSLRDPEHPASELSEWAAGLRLQQQREELLDKLPEGAKNPASALEGLELRESELAREGLARTLLGPVAATLEGMDEGLAEIEALRRAVDTRSPERYRSALSHAKRRLRLKPHAGRCLTAHARLTGAGHTPQDATALVLCAEELRSSAGECGITAGWKYAHTQQEVKRIVEASDEIPKTEEELRSLAERAQRARASMIEDEAWLCLLERAETDPEMLSRVRNVAASAQKMTKGGKSYGSRSRDLRAAAARAVKDVPAWIMPLHRVVEAFGADKELFDVVIVDEASQVGVEGFFVLSLAKQALVVGDDKQQSPERVGVGAGHDEFVRLRDKLLGDSVFDFMDGETSLYTMASVRAGSVTRLREHFRSHPKIIDFCNKMFYGGELLYLASPASDALPPLVPVYVPDARMVGKSDAKLNEAEAEALAAKLLACHVDEAYRGKSFGVVALQGKAAQVTALRAKIWERIGDAAWAERRLVVGTAADLQGSERDVVFLSIVAGPSGSELERKARLWRDDKSGPGMRNVRNLNVAASRAREQLLVFHSLHPTEFQEGDIRRSLIEHCRDTSSALIAKSRFDSVFESDVAKFLSSEGFGVTSQYQSLGYRIDLVAEGEGGARLAIECDGDVFHQDLRKDYERRVSLERVGWRFHRIWYSHWKASRETCQAQIIAALDAAGVRPSGR